LEFEDSVNVNVKSDSELISFPVNEPEDWRIVYDLIVEMRDQLNAPVDSMVGCFISDWFDGLIV
jgi:hypothetical protein